MILRIAKERFNTFMIAVSKPQQCTSTTYTSGNKCVNSCSYNTISISIHLRKKLLVGHSRCPRETVSETVSSDHETLLQNTILMSQTSPSADSQYLDTVCWLPVKITLNSLVCFSFLSIHCVPKTSTFLFFK